MPEHLLAREIHARTDLEQDRIDVLKGTFGIHDNWDQAENRRKRNYGGAAAPERHQEYRIRKDYRRGKHGGKEHFVACADQFVAPQQESDQNPDDG